MVDTHQYFDQALKIVLEAGKIMLNGFKSTKEITTKTNDQDFVTQYDKLIEHTIIENLVQIYPNHKFIAEESAALNVLTNEPTWILDPIDGTTNFIQGFPFCCISLALSMDKDLKVGIVYNPIMNQLFTAQKGKGAYLNNEKIYVSNTEDLINAMVGFDLAYTKDDNMNRYFISNFEFILNNCRGSRSLGSAAIHLCYLAMGAVDICIIKKLKCWDVAAGVLVIREAGGIVLDLMGDQYKDISNPDILTCSTRKLADNFLSSKKLMKIIQDT